MASRSSACQAEASESGTTLVELLVVISLLSIVGTLTTVGIVRSFRAQEAASGVSATLDESRIAVQRIRDHVRGADEICAGSTDTRLAVWTDSRDTGTQGVDDDDEVMIFEVDPVANTLVRGTRGSASTVLISDEIVNASAVFNYDVDPAVQAEDLTCGDGLAGSSARTSRVDLVLTVENPSAGPDLTTQTSLMLRNSGLAGLRTGGLAGSTNQPPVAEFVAPDVCVVNGVVPCLFDASGSSDPEGRSLTYAWDFDESGGAADSTLESDTHDYTVAGTYNVVLSVTDDVAQTTSAVRSVEVLPEGSNYPPIAAFTYECTGATCRFDAVDGSYINSSDPDDDRSYDPDNPDVSTLSFEWDFAGQGTSTDPKPTKSFSGEGPFTVSLTVTDAAGDDDTSSASIEADPNTVRVESLDASGTGVTSNQWTATLTVKITTTMSTAGVDDLVVSIAITGAKTGSASCTTGQGSSPSGTCSVSVKVADGNTATFTIDDVEVVPPYVYDANQNKATTITVGAGGTEHEPSSP